MGRVTHYDTVQMLAHLLSQRENVAKYWVTVTAGQTHTIQSLGIATGKSAVVAWGDGLSNEYTGTATRTHVYVNAGTYAVKIYTPENVQNLLLNDTKITSIGSAAIGALVNASSIQIYNLSASGVFLGSDLTNLKANTIYLNVTAMTGTFDSADVAYLKPSLVFRLYAMPGITGFWRDADFAGWNVGSFWIFGMSGLTPSVVGGVFSGFTACNDFRLFGTALSQTQINSVLLDLYTATLSRTTTGGIINLSGTNAAPSGTFQACQSPPVSASTPGKEIAYELLNDSLGVGFNKWATVSTN